MDTRDTILKFYSENDHLLPNAFPPLAAATLEHVQDDEVVFTNNNPGLGDTLSFFHLTKHFKQSGRCCTIWSPSMHFEHLVKFNKDYLDPDKLSCKMVHLMNVCDIQSFYGGSGHVLNQVEKAAGFEMSTKPAPNLTVDAERKRARVAINFTPGGVVAEQKIRVHPRARELYPEHRETIQKFINDNKNKYHFIEFGLESTIFENVESRICSPYHDFITGVASCEYFLGINGGVMHLAAALGLKGIIIINFPSAKQMYLPRLKAYTLPDLEWSYPQFVHLHEDDDGDLVKHLTYNNLERAFDGGIYPFWKDDYLDLILE